MRYFSCFQTYDLIVIMNLEAMHIVIINKIIIEEELTAH